MAKQPHFPVRLRDELMSMPAPRFLIDKVIPERALAVIYGPPGTGKTFVALDMALSICSNREWLGFETQTGSIIYITPEGLSGLKQRVQAWELHHQVQAGKFGYICEAPQFLDEVEVENLIQDIKVSSIPAPTLIVVDTLARHMVGGDENSASSMGEFIGGIDRLRQEFHCTVIVVHHTSKGNNGNFKERGSTALRGAADTMILIENAGIGIGVKCEKQKESEPFDDIPIGLQPIKLDDGSSSCACVLDEHIIFREDKLDPQKEKILKALLSADAEGLRSKEILSASGIPESSFHRQRNRLADLKLIEKCEGQRYRLTNSGREKALTLNPLPSNSPESPPTLPSLPTPFRGGSSESGGKEVA